MVDPVPTNTSIPAPAAPTVAGQAAHVLANPFAPSADVVAQMAGAKTRRSAEEVLAELVAGAGSGPLGRRTVRCILKPDHPLDHTTYGGVQFAKFTEIVSNGGALRYPQQGAINHLSEGQVARIVADARDCISRFYPGGRVKNVDGTYSPRRGRGFEGRISQLGETFVQEGDVPTYVPPRVVVNGEKRWIPLGLSDAEAARLLGVSEIAINEARREADVRSLIALEFDPKPQAEIPDSLEAAIEHAREAAHATMQLPRRGDPESSVYGRPVALGLDGSPTGGAVSAAAPGARFVGGPDAVGVSDEAQAAFASTGDKANGIPPLSPDPLMGQAKDAGIRVSGTGRPRR